MNRLSLILTEFHLVIINYFKRQNNNLNNKAVVLTKLQIQKLTCSKMKPIMYKNQLTINWIFLQENYYISHHIQKTHKILA